MSDAEQKLLYRIYAGAPTLENAARFINSVVNNGLAELTLEEVVEIRNTIANDLEEDTKIEQNRIFSYDLGHLRGSEGEILAALEWLRLQSMAHHMVDDLARAVRSSDWHSGLYLWPLLADPGPEPDYHLDGTSYLEGQEGLWVGIPNDPPGTSEVMPPILIPVIQNAVDLGARFLVIYDREGIYSEDY